MLKIESLWREVELLPRTRKISRQINEALFKWIVIKNLQWVWKSDDLNLDIPMENIEKSNELAVKLLFGLTQDEIDNLSEEDFVLLVSEISKKK